MQSEVLTASHTDLNPGTPGKAWLGPVSRENGSTEFFIPKQGHEGEVFNAVLHRDSVSFLVLER